MGIEYFCIVATYLDFRALVAFGVTVYVEGDRILRKHICLVM